MKNCFFKTKTISLLKENLWFNVSFKNKEDLTPINFGYNSMKINDDFIYDYI